jgi:hypothetical protein
MPSSHEYFVQMVSYSIFSVVISVLCVSNCYKGEK